MMEFEPQIGDPVWAKMKGFSPWPGRVVKPGPNSNLQIKKGSFWIHFFGSNNYAWIELDKIKPYFKFKEQFANVKLQSFKDALIDIEDYIAKKKAECSHQGSDVSGANSSSVNSVSAQDLYENDNDGASVEPDDADDEGEVKSESSNRINSKQTKQTSKESQLVQQNVPHIQISSDVVTARNLTKKPRHSSPSVKYDENGAAAGTTYDEEILNLPPILSKPDSPQIDLTKVSDNFKNKDILASSLAFGFKLLGNMGTSVVKYLVNSGHRVNLWNRSSNKAECSQQGRASVEPDDADDEGEVKSESSNRINSKQTKQTSKESQLVQQNVPHIRIIEEDAPPSQNHKRKFYENMDAVEHIFLGYAMTVKQFSPKRQAVTKLRIAEILMEQEIAHQEETQKA